MRRFYREIPTLAILFVALVAVTFPYAWTLLTSLKPEAAINRPLDLSIGFHSVSTEVTEC
jgi:ABC-type glycerol-3-phosphate transport system permease component